MKPKYFNSHYLNFIFWYFIVFVLSVAFLGLVTAFVTSHHFEKQITQKIELETNQLMVDYNQDGIDELWNDVRERVNLNQTNRFLYSIVMSSGEKDFDTIEVHEMAKGWQNISEPKELKALITPLKDGHKLIVASDLHDMRNLEKILASNFLVVVGLILILGLLGGVILSGRYLKRITEIQTVTNLIGEGHFDSRIPLKGSDDIFDEIAKIFNSMLDRIQILVHEIQRVSSNVAHEMRTPLGHIRQKLEVLSIDPTLKNQERVSVHEAILELDQTLSLFSSIMRLSEIKSGTRKSHFAQFDLSKILIELHEVYEPLVTESGRSIKCQIEEHLFVIGDSSLLKQLVVNLIENFIQHTPLSTLLTINLKKLDSHIFLIIKDNGPGIENVEFSLKAFNSGGTSHGAGLGLSLVDAIARLHEFSIDYKNDHGFEVSIKI